MTKDQIIQRMDKLGAAARQRMKDSPDNPNLVFAEIMWMSQEETAELLELRLMLPSAGQEREEAMARIQQKINQRKVGFLRKRLDSALEWV